jgi:hypothetical protein
MKDDERADQEPGRGQRERDHQHGRDVPRRIHQRRQHEVRKRRSGHVRNRAPRIGDRVGRQRVTPDGRREMAWSHCVVHLVLLRRVREGHQSTARRRVHESRRKADGTNARRRLPNLPPARRPIRICCDRSPLARAATPAGRAGCSGAVASGWVGPSDWQLDAGGVPPPRDRDSDAVREEPIGMRRQRLCKRRIDGGVTALSLLVHADGGRAFAQLRRNERRASGGELAQHRRTG